jgi:hypothetical protein
MFNGVAAFSKTIKPLTCRYMKKKGILLTIAISGISIVLLSWGVTGHRTIGKIAENHLSPNAKAAVKDLLGGESLADVSTWADEVRGEAAYRSTGPWHYINVPLGLSYPDFQKAVEEMADKNIFTALQDQEKIVTDKTAPRDRRVEALKFIVHFVGDSHQPMHVSRAEDKGGNTIQLNYDGQGTNLHSLWDTKLIEHEGGDYLQLAEKTDHASPAQIKQWQSDPMIKWVWESYQVSTKLYAEVDAMKSRSIDDRYYESHIGIIHERLEMAGIRLAGVLNTLFKDGPIAGAQPATGAATTPAAAPTTIELKDVASHINEYVKTSGLVYGYKPLEGLTLVNLGAAYPNQLMTVVLKGAAQKLIPALDGKTITVTGKLVLYKEKPEIVVTDPAAVTTGN